MGSKWSKSNASQSLPDRCISSHTISPQAEVPGPSEGTGLQCLDAPTSPESSPTRMHSPRKRRCCSLIHSMISEPSAAAAGNEVGSPTAARNPSSGFGRRLPQPPQQPQQPLHSPPQPLPQPPPLGPQMIREAPLPPPLPPRHQAATASMGQTIAERSNSIRSQRQSQAPRAGETIELPLAPAAAVAVTATTAAAQSRHANGPQPPPRSTAGSLAASSSASSPVSEPTVLPPRVNARSPSEVSLASASSVSSDAASGDESPRAITACLDMYAHTPHSHVLVLRSNSAAK